MLFIKSIPLGIFAALTFGTASADTVVFSTNWDNTTLSSDLCIRRAEVAMRDSGFSSINFAGQSGDRSVFGYRQEYSATIRCIASKNIIFFVVAGPSINTASNLRQRIQDNF